MTSNCVKNWPQNESPRERLLPPLSIQRQIMERVAAGRAEIAREINAEIEALILGTKRVG